MINYARWLKTAAIFQFINVLIHLSSFFITPTPNNDTEKQLFTLMDTYKFDLGAGFHRTMSEMTLVFSACLDLLCLLAGLLNWHLLKKGVAPAVMKGVISINLFVFGVLSVLTVLFTFIMPIVSIGFVVLFLILARLAVSKK